MFLDRADAIRDGCLCRIPRAKSITGLTKAQWPFHKKLQSNPETRRFDGISGARKESPSVRRACGRIEVCCKTRNRVKQLLEET
jgi:hypothetical protein